MRHPLIPAIKAAQSWYTVQRVNKYTCTPFYTFMIYSVMAVIEPKKVKKIEFDEFEMFQMGDIFLSSLPGLNMTPICAKK